MCTKTSRPIIRSGWALMPKRFCTSFHEFTFRFAATIGRCDGGLGEGDLDKPGLSSSSAGFSASSWNCRTWMGTGIGGWVGHAHGFGSLYVLSSSTATFSGGMHDETEIIASCYLLSSALHLGSCSWEKLSCISLASLDDFIQSMADLKKLRCIFTSY